MESIASCALCDFLEAVELLLYSSFSFLDKLLTMSVLRYLQPVSNERQDPERVCLTYCERMKFSYLTAILASSDLPFIERAFVNFRQHLIFMMYILIFVLITPPAKFRSANYFANTKIVFNHQNLLRKYMHCISSIRNRPSNTNRPSFRNRTHHILLPIVTATRSLTAHI